MCQKCYTSIKLNHDRYHFRGYLNQTNCDPIFKINKLDALRSHLKIGNKVFAVDKNDVTIAFVTTANINNYLIRGQ
jgi:hypothetical protein